MNTTIQLYQASGDDLLLQASANGVQVSSVERRALIAGSGRTIADTDPATLLGEVKAIVLGACRDLGIAKGPDAYDATRFLDYLKEYFPTMTTSEVKQAFEFYVAGILDEYLPKDRDGKVLQHYQQFSATFYTAILRAYRSRAAEAKKDLSGRVSLRLLEISSAERDPYEDRNAVLLTLKGLIVEIAEGKNPTMSLAGPAEPILKKLKLLPEAIVPTDSDIERAKARFVRNKDSAVLSSIQNAMKVGIIPDDVGAASRSVCARRLLRAEAEKLGAEEVSRRFDWLIEQNRKRQAKEANG